LIGAAPFALFTAIQMPNPHAKERVTAVVAAARRLLRRVGESP
jgi:hypothetical protein